MRRWSAIGVAFVGILIILRPGVGVMQPAALLTLAAAAMFALYQVQTRIVAAHDSPRTTTLYLATVGALALSLVGPFHWLWPDLLGWLVLIVVAVLGAIGHFLLISALELAPASVLQPFTYSAIVYATIVGYVVFGDLPDGPTVLGAAIVIASGLYSFHRERLRAAAAPLRPPAPRGET